MSFPISNMSSTYKIRNTIELPLNFLNTQGSFSFSMKPNDLTTSLKRMFQLRDVCFNINGFLKLAYFTSILWIDKTFGLYHIHVLFKISVKESCFDIHLLYLIIEIGSYS